MDFDNMERCDIVIPVWNNLDITRECVSSIRKYTRFPFKFIIVDNASDKPTADYLTTLKTQLGNQIEVIRNEKNLGFVKAVNQGMKAASADFICIMNNDTIVTYGWLDEMIEVLKNNDDVGIVNPSSNSSCQFPGKLDIHTYAHTLKEFSGQFQELYRARAFAMVVKREVVDKIGYLDDIYGMGYFDDTDYSKRAQASGYKVVRAKASYVFHKESRSFSKVKEKDAIFSENEKKFSSKWGRPVRVAYVITGAGERGDAERLSGNINSIVSSGHMCWVFTKKGVPGHLDLIDHESIKFFIYPPLMFWAVAAHKIIKRKKKKKIDLIVTSEANTARIYSFLRTSFGCDVMLDKDFAAVSKKIDYLSHLV